MRNGSAFFRWPPFPAVSFIDRRLPLPRRRQLVAKLSKGAKLAPRGRIRKRTTQPALPFRRQSRAISRTDTSVTVNSRFHFHPILRGVHQLHAPACTTRHHPATAVQNTIYSVFDIFHNLYFTRYRHLLPAFTNTIKLHLFLFSFNSNMSVFFYIFFLIFYFIDVTVAHAYNLYNHPHVYMYAYRTCARAISFYICLVRKL